MKASDKSVNTKELLLLELRLLELALKRSPELIDEISKKIVELTVVINDLIAAECAGEYPKSDDTECAGECSKSDDTE